MEELNYPEIKSAEKELLLDFEAGMSRSMGNRGKTIGMFGMRAGRRPTSRS